MTAVTFDKHTFDDMPSQVDNRQAKKGMCYGRFYQFHLCSSGFCGTQFLQRNKLTMWWSPKKKAVKWLPSLINCKKDLHDELWIQFENWKLSRSSAHNLLHIYRLSCPLLSIMLLIAAAGSKNCVVSVWTILRRLCVAAMYIKSQKYRCFAFFQTFVCVGHVIVELWLFYLCCITCFHQVFCSNSSVFTHFYSYSSKVMSSCAWLICQKRCFPFFFFQWEIWEGANV